MRRWDPINERQLALLRLVQAGEDLGVEKHQALRRHSAKAVRDRGLIKISRRHGTTVVEMTPLGHYYLEHGHHPERPASSRNTDGVIPVSEPPPAPSRQRRRRPTRNPEPSRIDARAISVPGALRVCHPVVAELRDDRGRLVMPTEVRRRSLLFLQGLAAEAVKRGHEVSSCPVDTRYHHHHQRYGPPGSTPRYSRREGELRIKVDSFGYVVRIQQVAPQSENSERIAKLVIELIYRSAGQQYRWTDGKTRTVEGCTGAVLREIETRAAEDRQHQIDEERARIDRKARWEHAMELARRRATDAYLAKALDTQVAGWLRARRLRAYRDELERCVSNLQRDGGDLSGAREWLSWIDDHIASTDPIESPPSMPSIPDLAPDDLVPFLDGLSPYGSELHRSRWPRS